jgi:preprotein translocase subunit SecF
MRLFSKANYKFLEQRRKAYVVSVVFIALGVLSIALRGGLNYGVDFTGGTLFQVRFDNDVEASDVRSALGAAGLTNLQVQNFGGASEYLIRMAEFLEGGDRELAQQVDRILDDQFGSDSYTVVRTEAVGPRVGEELRQRAVGAVLIAFVLTLIYLGFRFEWRFGLAAIIATVHDIMIAFGVISVLNIEISLPTVAAILTIIGYSLNDTIVIFDRIRENLKKHRRSPSPSSAVRSSASSPSCSWSGSSSGPTRRSSSPRRPCSRSNAVPAVCGARATAGKWRRRAPTCEAVRLSRPSDRRKLHYGARRRPGTCC